MSSLATTEPPRYNPLMARILLQLRHAGRDRVSLSEFLCEALPPELERAIGTVSVSRSKVRRLVVAGAVRVNGKQERRPGAILNRGDGITALIDPERFAYEKENDDVAFELTRDRILFEDDAIIVVDKPARFPTEATALASRDHLQAAVARYLGGGYVGIHHRLDRDTSGAILFTKDRRANAGAHALFEGRLARKEYEALTILPDALKASAAPNVGETFSVRNRLARVSPKGQAGKWGAVESGGDEAITDFRVLARGPGLLRVLALPLTGRTHQIRVHLSAFGLPLLGDVLYGGPEEFKGQRVPRAMLHAARLSFPHPIDGKVIEVEAPLPADFLELLNAIGAGLVPRE